MSRHYLLLALLGHSFIALCQSSSGGAADEGPLVVFANPNDPTLSVSPSQIPVSSSNSADGGLAVLSIFSSALATFRTGGISASASSAPPNSEPPLLNPTSTSLEGSGSLSPVSPSPAGVQSTRPDNNPQSTVVTSVPGGVVVVVGGGGGGVFTPASESPPNSIQTSLGSLSMSTQSETTSISSSLTATSTISNSSTTTTQQDTAATTQSPPSSNSQPSKSITESSSIDSTASSGTEASTTSGVPPASTTAAPVAATPGTGSSLSPLGASYSLFGVLLTFLVA